jgi:hypothetical protein
MTRAECKDGPRPCKRILCRYHLWMSHQCKKGALKHYPGTIYDMEDTCALDVADRGPTGLREIAALMGMTYQRVQQIEQEARSKVQWQSLET